MREELHITERPITVLLAEDHVIMRNAVLALLTLEGDMRVVGQAGTGLQAVALASKLCPDVVVMDINLPLLNGLDATQQIRATLRTTQVLIFSDHSHDIYIERAKAVGAAGYLSKQSDAELLPEAIREVHRGKAFFRTKK